VPAPSRFNRSQPSRVIVGTSYYYASGVIRSLTQLKRLEKAGRITPMFKNGSRRAQLKHIADADIARLLPEQSGDGEAT
jgi:hypothetical protein